MSRGLRCSISIGFLQALPKALSRPTAQYVFQPTALTAKTLGALLALRGPGRGGDAAVGGWSIFADGSVEGSPLDRTSSALKRKLRDGGGGGGDSTAATGGGDGITHEHIRQPMTRPIQEVEQRRIRLRRRLVANGRFGSSAIVGDGRGIERLEIRLEDPFPPRLPSSSSAPLRRPATTVASRPGRTRPGARPLGERHLNRTVISGRPLHHHHLPLHLQGAALPMSSSTLPSTGRMKNLNVKASKAIKDQGDHEEVVVDENDNEDHNDVIHDQEQAPPTPKPNHHSQSARPEIRLVFHGTHIFAGIRRLVEEGLVDGETMPGWMTGQDGISLGVVRRGRVLSSSNGPSHPSSSSSHRHRLRC